MKEPLLYQPPSVSRVSCEKRKRAPRKALIVRLPFAGARVPSSLSALNWNFPPRDNLIFDANKSYSMPLPFCHTRTSQDHAQSAAATFSISISVTPSTPKVFLGQRSLLSRSTVRLIYLVSIELRVCVGLPVLSVPRSGIATSLRMRPVVPCRADDEQKP
jgi:hypothetical protein